MDVGRMRCEVSKQYPGKKWKEKVKKMRDDQIIKLFYEFLNRQAEEKAIKQILDFPPKASFEDIFANNTATSAKIDVNCITMPFEDTTMFGQTICSKDVLLAGWLEMVGQYFEIDKRTRQVKGVKVVGEFIFIDLE